MLNNRRFGSQGSLCSHALAVVGVLCCAVGWSQPYIATSQNYFCAGQLDPVNLYCNVLAFDPETNVEDWTFLWSPASEVSDPASQTIQVNPSETTMYSAVMTAPDGSVYLDDITITVYPEFSVQAMDLAECSTDGAGLEASVTISNPVEWMWQPSTGLSNSSIANPQIVGEITSTFTVTATISGLGGVACFASTTILVESIFAEMELGEDVVACTGDVVVIDPELPADYIMDWSVAGETGSSVSLTESTTIGLTATSPEGCSNSDVIDVIFSDGPEINLVESITVCASSGALLDATPSDLSSGPFTYSWSNGGNSNAPIINESGIYVVTVTDEGGCSSQATVEVNALPSPEFYFPADTVLCFDDFPNADYRLSVPAGFAGYVWYDGQSGNQVTVDVPGVYGVTVQNEIGCETEKSVVVTNFCSLPLLFIPNAFTPDGDGLNEVLRIEGQNLVQLEFTIYNRWGNVVWTADSLGDYWHGQGPNMTHYVPDEMYLWKARYRHYTDTNGSLSTWYEDSGSIQVLR